MHRHSLKHNWLDWYTASIKWYIKYWDNKTQWPYDAIDILNSFVFYFNSWRNKQEEAEYKDQH